MRSRINIHLAEAIGRIHERTNGRMEIKLFPANQLGTETDVLSQVRNGGIELPMLTSFFSAIGASSTPMNFAEVYTSLQTGIIDGQENALSLISSTRLYEAWSQLEAACGKLA